MNRLHASFPFRRHILSIASVLVLLVLVTFCTSDGTKVAPQSMTVSMEIGPEGGVIVGSNGFKIEIPAGALNATTTITLTMYATASSMPAARAPLPGFLGAVEAEPDGLLFQQPVTLTIPCSKAMTPGTSFPLHMWNETQKHWKQTDSLATVGADGNFFSASVTHFSAYAGFDEGSFLDGGSAVTFMNDFVDWFQQNVKKSGDRRAKDNECFVVVGLDFDLQYEINGTYGSGFTRIGETSSNTDAPLTMADFTYDASDGHTSTGYVIMTVVIYYDCTPPDFDLTADRVTLLEGEDTTVRARILCGDMPLAGKQVTFEIASGPGTINPGASSTDASGNAAATFTAGDGDSVIRATYTSCESSTPTDLVKTLATRVTPDQFQLSISFDQTASAPPDFSSTFSYSGTVHIAVTGDNGDGTAPVEGTGTCSASGQYSSGDCTSTIFGGVNFSAPGTLTVNPDGSKTTLTLNVTVTFDTMQTIVCDDDEMTVPYTKAAENFELLIPVENGFTIDHTLTEGITTNHIVYVLTF